MPKQKPIAYTVQDLIDKLRTFRPDTFVFSVGYGPDGREILFSPIYDIRFCGGNCQIVGHTD